MTFDQWITEIKDLTAARFHCCEADDRTRYLEGLVNEKPWEALTAQTGVDDSSERLKGEKGPMDRGIGVIEDTSMLSAQVLRVHRVGEEKTGYRTILVAQVDTLVQASVVLHWCAKVRDALPEPATADVYLFLNIKSATIEDCVRIESDDQYCRKQVLRPGESNVEFLARTFLAAPIGTDDQGELADPVLASLIEVAKTHPWFSTEEQMRWHKVLLSGATGAELAEQLLMQDGRRAE